MNLRCIIRWRYIIIKKTIIIKIGGSVITHKHREGAYIRRKQIKQVARELVEVLAKDKKLQLIIIHGAGAGGHQIAKKYKLENGTNNDPYKIFGALTIRNANQELNLTIVKIFMNEGLIVTPIHSGSIIIQNNMRMTNQSFEVIDSALKNNCIPIMYGEMVFDKTLGMSICSGDAIAMLLAKHYNAKKIIFASDIDGIFDEDPHVHPNAKLIKRIDLQTLFNNDDIALTGSHNVDVTGGLANKVAVLTSNGMSKALKKVVVCNGLKSEVIKKSFSEKEEGTVIRL